MLIRSHLLMLLSLFVAAQNVSAEELAPYEIVPDGRQYEIRLGTNQRSLDTISVFFVSTGNISNAVTVQVSGPAGIVGTARGGSIGADSGVSALASSSTVLPYVTRTYPSKKEQPSFATAAYGSDSSQGYVGATFHIQKDACANARTSRHVVQVKFDLTGIDRALYDNVFSITIAVNETPFKGAKVASIKPSSDGKYRGEPILLMGTVGYGDEYVNKVTWRGGKIVAKKRLPIVKYVSYFGYGLSLARIKSILQGGKHTFELSDGGAVYGVCLKAARERQRVNGYPGS